MEDCSLQPICSPSRSYTAINKAINSAAGKQYLQKLYLSCRRALGGHIIITFSATATNPPLIITLKVCQQQ